MNNQLHRTPSALRRRVLQRVQDSHAHESQFLTVRREAGGWSSPQPGVRARALARTGVAQSSLVELAPHAALPISVDFTQVELVLLEGLAWVGDDLLTCGDAACVPCDARHLLRASEAGARLYLRLSAPETPAIATLRFSTLADDSTWDDFCPGVRIKMLCGGGGRSSVLVRMCAGAHVNAHSHSLEEECMMLASFWSAPGSLLATTSPVFTPVRLLRETPYRTSKS